VSAGGQAVPDRTWHRQGPDAVARSLATDAAAGLSAAEAAARLDRHGPNELREKPPRSLPAIFLGQFRDFMILVLLAAALVSGLVGDLKDTLAILVIVVLNAVIGLVQEYRAERAMAALKRLAAASSRVIRGGRQQTIPARELVPGDLVLLEAGNVVPADLRLVEAASLKTDESLLTGESQTVDKHTEALAEAELPPGDRRNLAFKGTTVTYGRGQGIVVATGMDTELGRIALLLDSGLTLDTPLQRRMAAFGKRLGIAVLAICALLLAVGLLRGEPPVLMFLTAVSLAVAAIPEALPAVTTISLALGARTFVRHNALIRRLPAVETLGSVTYICSDKTGTLTRNRMVVQELWAAGSTLRAWQDCRDREPWHGLLTALALSNDAAPGGDGGVLGDPTEVALWEAGGSAGCIKAELEERFPRIGEAAFDSERKRMTTVHRLDEGAVSWTKGAPESVIPLCGTMLAEEGPVPLDAEAALAAAERMAAEGLRVLAVAERHWSGTVPVDDPAALEQGLCLLGLVGLMDPPRPEARDAVAQCRSAGIIPVMITGDHPATAAAIARELGIAGEGDEVISGAELARMDDAELSRRVERLRVYARVDPAQKIRIVQALQSRHQFVAMTGDGVNDAPALRAADIGVAMGLGGTDVAREAASLVLLDDNFATIVRAVREGRRIFDNIRKFIKYTMTSNSGEIWTLFLAPFLGLPIPLLPIHILWINLVTDGLPGLALAAEPGERNLMKRPPRPPGESIFAHGMWQHIVWVGLTMGGISLLTQALAIRAGSDNWQTMVFTVLTLSQMGHVLAVRSERDSLFSQGLWSNRPLLGAVALTFLLQMATIYVPVLNPVFNTAPLSLGELAFCLVMSTVVFVAAEAEKVLVRRGWIYRPATAGAGRVTM
jgi:Ca2+-transporting ATPase